MTKKNNSGPPKNPAIPAFTADLGFPPWERELFYALKPNLSCDLCGLAEYANRGVNGEPCQGGFRLISLKCSNDSCDAGSERFLKVLERSALDDVVMIYKNNYQAAVTHGLKTYSNTTSVATKKRRKDGPVEESASDPKVPDLENLPIKEIMSELAAMKLEMSKAQVERNELRSLIEENSKLREENEKLKSEIAKLKSTPPELETTESYASKAQSASPTPKEAAKNSGLFLKPKTKLKKFSKEDAVKMFQPLPAPVEFERIHVQIYDRKELLKCSSAAEKTQVINSVVQKIGLADKVAAKSLIGNSLLELYVPKHLKDDIKVSLKEKNISLTNFIPEEIPSYAKTSDCSSKIINRLSYLYRKSRFTNLKECILRGYSDKIRNAVLASITEMQL